ncbi:MAG: glycosyltransferase [Deltaproteobacteria bacterium]|nr:glycosyltransferase [Deltaproteobacteria bacterium]
MSVLNVYRTYYPDPPGGLQEAIRQICLATGQCDVTNTIFTLSPSPVPAELLRPEGRVFRCRSWAAPASCDLGGVSAFLQFRRLADQADVIHYFFPWPFADVLHAVACPKKPTVLTYISDIVRQRWMGKFYAPLMWHTLQGVSSIVANCPAYAQTSPVLTHPSIRDKVSVIPLGIVEESYHQVADEAVLNRLGVGDGSPFFLFIGVLRYYKGLHTLLQAAAKLRVQVVIAGSGPEDEALREQARQLGLSNLIFAGQVSNSEKVALLKSCRALILPSHLRSEAYGMVLVEAAMFSRPMISCEIGTGTSFVNVDGETGIVVPPENPDELARAMNQLLDESVAEHFGQNARRRYELTFSGNKLGNAYAELFRKVARK